MLIDQLVLITFFVTLHWWLGFYFIKPVLITSCAFVCLISACVLSQMLLFRLPLLQCTCVSSFGRLKYTSNSFALLALVAFFPLYYGTLRLDDPFFDQLVSTDGLLVCSRELNCFLLFLVPTEQGNTRSIFLFWPSIFIANASDADRFSFKTSLRTVPFSFKTSLRTVEFTPKTLSSFPVLF